MICKECGSDPFKAADYDKLTREYNEVCERFKRVMARHGLENAEWDLERIRLTDSMKWMQRKTNKQAKAIARLEEKLKKLNTQPYAEEE